MENQLLKAIGARSKKYRGVGSLWSVVPSLEYGGEKRR